jgi:pimeloyl-ACP methyl ester carboxylesterase
MGEAKARANGIDIAYEVMGDAAAPPMLLIMGLGGQMVLWEDDFCRMLVERGHRIIRFDNRDVGKSTHFREAGLPDMAALMTAAFTGQPVSAPYTLSDMARDCAGLLDALAIERADIVGASMGGMIAQTLAIEHPRRVRTLTSIMSSTGNPALPPPNPEAIAFLLSPIPADRAGAIEHGVNMFRTIGSPSFPFEEARIRRLAGLQYERGIDPAGVLRQLAAIVASGNRTEKLGSVTAPTLVIHGKADPLVPFEAGAETAAAIPGARLEGVEGMGHDLPMSLWPRLVDWISSHASAAR